MTGFKSAGMFLKNKAHIYIHVCSCSRHNARYDWLIVELS